MFLENSYFSWFILLSNFCFILASTNELFIKEPRNGSQVLPHFAFAADLTVEDHIAFIKEQGPHAVICLLLDGIPQGCNPFDSPLITVENASLGPHVLEAYMANQASGAVLTETAHVHVEVVTMVQEGVDPTNVEQVVSESRALTDWYLAEVVESPAPVPKSTNQKCVLGETPCLLAIGIKTSVLSFRARQALRETWFTHPFISSGRQHPHLRVCVWFVVGTPPEEAPPVVSEALRYEASTYEDVLTAPVVILEDSYINLVEKTKTFIRLACGTTTTSSGPKPPFQFLMMADDDIYLDVEELSTALATSAPLKRFYAGQVWEHQLGRPLRPQRDPRHRNHLSVAQWPLDTLLPFAVGPHYLLSADLAAFVATNHQILKGTGTLEDVSMAVWMLSLGVVPQHVDKFQTVKDGGCRLDSTSLADFTPDALKLIHDKLIRGESFCEDFTLDWVRTSRANHLGASPYQLIEEHLPTINILIPAENDVITGPSFWVDMNVTGVETAQTVCIEVIDGRGQVFPPSTEACVPRNSFPVQVFKTAEHSSFGPHSLVLKLYPSNQTPTLQTYYIASQTITVMFE